MNDIAILLLAAGGSSRMDQCKQLLQFRGKSLLRHAADVAIAAGVGPVFIILGSEAARLSQEIHDLPLQITINPDWQKGIGTSIRAGIREVLGAESSALIKKGSQLSNQRSGLFSAAIIMLGDQPLIDVEVLRSLARTFAEMKKPIVASKYGDSVGVPALFARRCFPQLLTLGDGEGAKRIILQPEANTAFIPVPAATTDIDTPEDYERLQTGQQS
jgi:molybdenum cofactor cytidylyltransferase